MFHLETAIIVWRGQMLAAGIKSPALEELENHLREEVERQIKSGVDGQGAFEISVSRVGPPEMLKREFKKSEWASDKRLGIFALLAGGVIILRIIFRILTESHGVTDPGGKMGWLFLGIVVIAFGLGKTVFNFGLGTTPEVRLWKLVGITYSGVAVWISVLPILNILRLPAFGAAFDTTALFLAFAAVAASILSVFGWRRCRGVLPVIHDRLTRSIVGIVCSLLGPGCMALFIGFVVPHRGHFPAPLFLVMLAWMWTAMAVLGGVGYGLAEAARRQSGSDPTKSEVQYV